MRAIPTGHPARLRHYRETGTALTDLGARDRLCVVRRWGRRLPRSPGSTSSSWPGQKGLRALWCALRGVSSRPGPQRGAVGVPEQAAAAATPQVGAAGPLGAPGSPSCSAWLPTFLRAHLPGASWKPGHRASQLHAWWVTVITSQGRTRLQHGPGGHACAGLRWGCVLHTGQPLSTQDSVIPGMSLIRSFCHGEASPGPLIRSHSPSGLPPALSHADNSQGTVGGQLRVQALRPTSGGTVTATHEEGGGEDHGLEPLKDDSVH